MLLLWVFEVGGEGVSLGWFVVGRGKGVWGWRLGGMGGARMSLQDEGMVYDRRSWWWGGCIDR